MARHDFKVYDSTTGATDSITSFPLSAGALFDEGEPLIFDGAGAVTEALDDPVSIAGIAAMRSVDVDSAVLGAGAPISVTQPVDTQRWICRNFATDGLGTPAVPTQANAVGAVAGFSLTAGNWFVDTGTVNWLVSIEAVVNRRGQPLGSGPGPGVAVVFRFLT